MATVFDDILLRGVRKGELPGRTQRSRDWFRQQAKTSRVGKLKAGDVTDFNKNVGLKDYDRFRNRTSIGEMFFFNYDPKNKSTLPSKLKSTNLRHNLGGNRLRFSEITEIKEDLSWKKSLAWYQLLFISCLLPIYILLKFFSK